MHLLHVLCARGGTADMADIEAFCDLLPMDESCVKATGQVDGGYCATIAFVSAEGREASPMLEAAMAIFHPPDPDAEYSLIESAAMRTHRLSTDEDEWTLATRKGVPVTRAELKALRRWNSTRT